MWEKWETTYGKLPIFSDWFVLYLPQDGCIFANPLEN